MPRDCQLDKRVFVKKSLGTKNHAAALAAARDFHTSTEALWAALLSGENPETAWQRYDAATRIARAFGFSYLRPAEIRDGSLAEIISRVTIAHEKQESTSVVAGMRQVGAHASRHHTTARTSRQYLQRIKRDRSRLFLLGGVAPESPATDLAELSPREGSVGQPHGIVIAGLLMLACGLATPLLIDSTYSSCVRMRAAPENLCDYAVRNSIAAELLSGLTIGLEETMRALNIITLLLIIVGGLNWGLVGAFEFNLVDALFGAGSVFSKAVYVLVGVSAIWQLIPFVRSMSVGETAAQRAHGRY